jgi:hypothetical protein
VRREGQRLTDELAHSKVGPRVNGEVVTSRLESIDEDGVGGAAQLFVFARNGVAILVESQAVDTVQSDVLKVDCLWEELRVDARLDDGVQERHTLPQEVEEDLRSGSDDTRPP